jgi:hypothetical protein
MKEPRCLRSMVFNSNLSYSGMICLDHSVHKDDIHLITLKIENPKNPFLSDKVWGSFSVSISIVESDRGITKDVLAVTGSYRVGASLLSKHKRNPRHLNMAMNQNVKDGLTDLFKKRMILDRTSGPNAQRLDFSKVAGSAADSVDLEEREEDFNSPPPPVAQEVGTSDGRHARFSEPATRSRVSQEWLNSTPRSRPPQSRSPLAPPIWDDKIHAENQSHLQGVPSSIQVPYPLRSPPPQSGRLYYGTPPTSPKITYGDDYRSPKLSPTHPSSSPKPIKSAMKGGRDLVPEEKMSPLILATEENKELVQTTNVGTSAVRAQIYATSEHPHIIATTDALPSLSRLNDLHSRVPSGSF